MRAALVALLLRLFKPQPVDVVVPRTVRFPSHDPIRRVLNGVALHRDCYLGIVELEAAMSALNLVPRSGAAMLTALAVAAVIVRDVASGKTTPAAGAAAIATIRAAGVLA